MVRVFYARKREGIPRYLEASGMYIVPYRHFWHHCLVYHRALSIDSGLLVTVPKLQLIFAALNQFSIINVQ